MTLTLDDADVMIEAAERHGVQLMVNVKHSFDPHIRKIREIVQSGELGRLRMLHYWYFSRLAVPATDCRRTQPQPGRWGHLAARAASVRYLAHHRRRGGAQRACHDGYVGRASSGGGVPRRLPRIRGWDCRHGRLQWL